MRLTERLLLFMLTVNLLAPAMAQKERPQKFKLIDVHTGRPYSLGSNRDVTVLYNAPPTQDGSTCSMRMLGRVSGLDEQGLHVMYKSNSLYCNWLDTLFHEKRSSRTDPQEATIPSPEVQRIFTTRGIRDQAAFLMIVGFATEFALGVSTVTNSQGNRDAFANGNYQQAALAGLAFLGTGLVIYLAVPTQRELRLP